MCLYALCMSTCIPLCYLLQVCNNGLHPFSHIIPLSRLLFKYGSFSLCFLNSLLNSYSSSSNLTLSVISCIYFKIAVGSVFRLEILIIYYYYYYYASCCYCSTSVVVCVYNSYVLLICFNCSTFSKLLYLSSTKYNTL
jgi:hypothetical protein